MFNKEKLQERMDMIEAQAPGKYQGAGLYSISVGDKLVYIGKSTDLKKRLGSHLLNILDDGEDKDSNKYKVLREANKRGLPISFDLIYKAESENYEDEIGIMEGALIREYLPPLNYQIPREDNYRRFTVQKTAKTITLEEIVA